MRLETRSRTVSMFRDTSACFESSWTQAMRLSRDEAVPRLAMLSTVKTAGFSDAPVMIERDGTGQDVIEGRQVGRANRASPRPACGRSSRRMVL